MTPAQIKMQTIRLIAETVRKMTSEETQAHLIASLLTCEECNELSDDEADVGSTLFDLLCDYCGPDVVGMAQSL